MVVVDNSAKIWTLSYFTRVPKKKVLLNQKTIKFEINAMLVVIAITRYLDSTGCRKLFWSFLISCKISVALTVFEKFDFFYFFLETD